MLPSLQFVKRAAKNNAVFAIRNGHVTASDGVITMSAPLNLSFNAAPAAVPFLRALNACEEAMSITQESESRLIVRSGSFKASVPCLDLKTIPVCKPEGQAIPTGEIVAAFKALRPFVCSDPARPNLQGILFNEKSAFATNNIVVAEYWLNSAFPNQSNVPVEVIDEVIRICEEPVNIQLAEGSITFNYKDGRWIKSPLNSLTWPDVAVVLNKSWENAQLVPVSEALKKACSKLADYVGSARGLTYFRGDNVASAKDDGEDGIATVATPAPVQGTFWTRYLSDVLNLAQQADFSMWPRPVPFAGGKVRGIIVGARNE